MEDIIYVISKGLVHLAESFLEGTWSLRFLASSQTVMPTVASTTNTFMLTNPWDTFGLGQRLGIYRQCVATWQPCYTKLAVVNDPRL